MIILSVFDNLANKYSTPFFIETEAEGLRLFKMTVNDPKNTLIFDNPEDYSLYKLGYFDERTGSINFQPEKLADAKSVKKEA